MNHRSTEARGGVGNTRLRHAVFTYNNYPDNAEQELRDICTDPRVLFCVFQKEIGEETKTPHLQGYIQFKNRLAFKTVKNLLPRTVHFEAARGTPTEARAYCTKTDTRAPGAEPVEIGDFDPNIGKSGTRNDLIAIKRKIDEGKSEADICADDECFSTWAKYPNLYKRYKSARIAPRDRNVPPEVNIIVGPTGTGKTRRVFDAMGDDVYVKDHTKWWDGYTGQRAILLDEFSSREHFGIEETLRLLDRYPYQGQTKGGYVNINSPYIWVTSNIEFEQHFINVTQEQLDALNRRISNKINL